MTAIRVLSLHATSTFLALNRVARLSVCAVGAIALLTPAAHAAAGGNQRVSVKYASKFVHITPSRRPLRTGTDSAKSTVDGIPAFKSNAVLVVDFSDGQTLYSKNPQNVAPIASITKLMTAMVVLDAGLPLARGRKPGRPSLAVRQYECAGQEPGVENRLVQDRLHQTGRTLPRNASEDRGAAGDYRSARFVGKANKAGRREPHKDVAGRQHFTHAARELVVK